MKPAGVRIRRANGQILNCELAHSDPEPDGTDTWAIANVLYQNGDTILVAHMPHATSLKFNSLVDPDEIDITWDDDAD